MQDLGWSYDSSILVSVGLDSRIVVWSGYTFEKLKTISVHQSHVKGITFDPANKYFATSSDDRTVKIFRYTPPGPNTTAYDQTSNFMHETTVTAPFTSSPLTTYFRRCSWSPDGQHIAAANAVNGPVSTCAIVNRGSWDSEFNLIGHEGPIEVCAFSPRIFNSSPSSDANSQRLGVTVIACAGQDGALSIWNTASAKPLVITESLCMKSISDISWTPDGEKVFVTSLDGTIALVSFARGEIGYPSPLETNEECLAKYGGGKKIGLLEGPDGVVFEEKSKSDELKNVQGRMGELMGDSNTAGPVMMDGVATDGAQPTDRAVNGTTKPLEHYSNDPPNEHLHGLSNGKTSQQQARSEDPNSAKVERLKQRVTVTKDGKKRVAPLLVSSSAGVTESSLPSSQLMASKSQSNRDDAPQNVLDLSRPYDGLPKGGIASLLVGNKRKLAESGTEDDSNIRQRTDASDWQGSSSILVNTVDGLASATRSFAQDAVNSQPSLLNPSLMLSQIRLGVPHIRSHIVRPLKGPRKAVDGRDGSYAGFDQTQQLEVVNAIGPSRTGRAQDRDPSRVMLTRRGQTLWQDFLPRPVTLVTGNPRFWAAACDDGSIYVWTPAGRRLFSAFALEAQSIILDCRGPWLLAVTSVGQCHVWNVATSTSPHPPVSLAPVLDIAALSQGPHLTNGPSVIFARLNSIGCIFVAMSNGDAFTYSRNMYVWQRVSEPWWAVGSQYWNTTDTTAATQSSLASSSNRTNISSRDGPSFDDEVHIENISAGVIPLLERNTTSQTLLRGRSYFLQRLVKALLSAEGYEGFESSVSVAHLENRLAAALALGAKDEFKLYLGMYAKRLGAEGARLKIEELLRSLLSGVFDRDKVDESGKQDARAGDKSIASVLTDGSDVYMGGPHDELCGWKKSVLLKEVLLILGKQYFCISSCFFLFFLFSSQPSGF